MSWANFWRDAISVVVVVSLVGGGIYGSIQVAQRETRKFKENQARIAAITSLANQAQTISAGEDRIWTTNEKRSLLDDLGVRAIIGDNQDIYFRVVNQDNGRYLKEPLAEFVAGYNLENDGGFLRDSSASSGTRIGRVSYKTLQDYVARHENN